MMMIGIAVLLLVIGFVLLIHHGYHHMDDQPDSKAKRESVAAVCYFQLSDISNHETWILVCWSNALTLCLFAMSLKEECM